MAEAPLLSRGDLRHSRAVVSVFFSGLEFVPLSMYPPFTVGFRRSSMAFGGRGSCFVISDLLVKALVLVLPGVKRPLSTWLVLLVSTAFPCPLTPVHGFHNLDFDLWFSEITNVEMVLGRVIDRLREYSGQDVAVRSSRFLLVLWRLAGFSDFLVRVTFVSCSSSTSWTVTFVSLSVASYSGDDRRTPGIQGNEENLTFLWSWLMVENGHRFLKIIKMI
ncbi:hypothetical protein F2Q69_00004160 [Brassica cretica]|uniref:Uncharacterized protein n=1 Tax=Brassica cretica TaxID=69181 RepID=A0A8S9P4G0_BRACR|nr:hypothetical protein F2Q69_00004160 [Brassica cretica]